MHSYYANRREESVKYDNDNDGAWDVVDVFSWASGPQPGPETAARSLAAEGGALDIAFIHGSGGADVKTGSAGVDWIELGPGDDTMTGGGGNDVFVFKRGDGTDIITDLEPGDAILIRPDHPPPLRWSWHGSSWREPADIFDAGDLFDPGAVELERLALTSGDLGMPGFAHIPESLFPADSSTADIAVLAYGGGPDDRIIIVGGSGTAAYYRDLFLTHAGDVGD